MPTTIIVWADEKKWVNIFKTRILRAIRESIGRCENCGSTKKLTIHHCSDSWLFDIVVYCQKCHRFWHWLIDPKRKQVE